MINVISLGVIALVCTDQLMYNAVVFSGCKGNNNSFKIALKTLLLFLERGGVTGAGAKPLLCSPRAGKARMKLIGMDLGTQCVPSVPGRRVQ